MLAELPVFLPGVALTSIPPSGGVLGVTLTRSRESSVMVLSMPSVWPLWEGGSPSCWPSLVRPH